MNETVSKINGVHFVPGVAEAEAENVAVVSGNCGVPGWAGHGRVGVKVAGAKGKLFGPVILDAQAD